MPDKPATKRLKRRQEIDRLFRCLKNFLTVGYDKNYQSTESAIEQLNKLRKLARCRTTEVAK